MLFPTMAFAIFFLAVYAIAWSLERENGRRKLFLLLASWVFYGWWDWRFLLLLSFSAVIDYAMALRIVDHVVGDPRRKRWHRPCAASCARPYYLLWQAIVIIWPPNA